MVMKFNIVQIDNIWNGLHIHILPSALYVYTKYTSLHMYFSKKINQIPFSYFGACPVLCHRSYQVTGVAPVDPPISARGWSLRIYDQPKWKYNTDFDQERFKLI